MGIRIVLEQHAHEGSPDLFCPQVFCDHCGERITGVGNYEYEMDLEAVEPVSGALFFTHKHCCYAFEQAHGGRARWHTDELQRLPGYLASNLGNEPLARWAYAQRRRPL